MQKKQKYCIQKPLKPTRSHFRDLGGTLIQAARQGCLICKAAECARKNETLLLGSVPGSLGVSWVTAAPLFPRDPGWLLDEPRSLAPSAHSSPSEGTGPTALPPGSSRVPGAWAGGFQVLEGGVPRSRGQSSCTWVPSGPHPPSERCGEPGCVLPWVLWAVLANDGTRGRGAGAPVRRGCQRPADEPLHSCGWCVGCDWAPGCGAWAVSG